jgi:prophage regulatory protein
MTVRERLSGLDTGANTAEVAIQVDRELAEAGLQMLVTERVVLAATGGWSPRQLRREVVAGRFPKPVRPSPGRIAWVAAEVAEWQRRCIGAREAAA